MADFSHKDVLRRKCQKKYREFVQAQDRLPEGKQTASYEEKSLARWAAQQRFRSKTNKLSATQTNALEAIPGWRWTGQAEAAGVRKCGWGSGFSARIHNQTESGSRNIYGPQRATEAQAEGDYLRLKAVAKDGEEEVMKVKGDLCDEAEDDALQDFIRPIRERLGMSKDFPEGREKMERLGRTRGAGERRASAGPPHVRAKQICQGRLAQRQTCKVPTMSEFAS